MPGRSTVTISSPTSMTLLYAWLHGRGWGQLKFDVRHLRTIAHEACHNGTLERNFGQSHPTTCTTSVHCLLSAFLFPHNRFLSCCHFFLPRRQASYLHKNNTTKLNSVTVSKLLIDEKSNMKWIINRNDMLQVIIKRVEKVSNIIAKERGGRKNQCNDRILQNWDYGIPADLPAPRCNSRLRKWVRSRSRRTA